MTQEQKKEILILRKEGLKFREISEKLGISLNTVKSYWRRCGNGDTLKKIPHGFFRCKKCGAVGE